MMIQVLFLFSQQGMRKPPYKSIFTLFYENQAGKVPTQIRIKQWVKTNSKIV